MSHADYQDSLQLAVHDHPLPVLIMTAMQKGRRPDQEKLREVFPDIWAELLERQRCFGGLLAGERVVSDQAAAAQTPSDTNTWTTSAHRLRGETSRDASRHRAGTDRGPRRRVKFVGMSMDSLDDPPEIDDEMTFIVHTRCVGAGRKRMKDGELRRTRDMEVLTLEPQGGPVTPTAGPNLVSVGDGDGDDS